MLAYNIKFLRKRKGKTQEEMAADLDFKRSTLNGYENGIAEPGIDNLIKIASYFNISVDVLITSDINLSDLEENSELHISGDNLRILTTSVNEKNEENIELVPLKASAGYTQGYRDPEYIQALPTFQLPFLSKEKKYRAFQIKGDSMLPIEEGSWIIAEFVQNWNEIKDGNAYIVLTNDDGLVFKVLYKSLKSRKNILLKSLNPLYQPYELQLQEVKEVWKFVNYISSQLPDVPQDEVVQGFFNGTLSTTNRPS
jgi:transcriptional regulator with XRE-family HTH domain